MTTRDKLFVLVAVIVIAGCLLATLQVSSRAQAGEEAGRYVMESIVMEAESKAAVIVMDTETGEVWAHALAQDEQWVSLGSPAAP